MNRERILQHLDGKVPDGPNKVSWALNTIIAVSAVAISLETMQGLPHWAYEALRVFEFAILLIFLAEYLLRIYCAEKRLRYIFSAWGLIDLVSCLPGLVFFQPQWQVVRTFRLLRILRVLKLFRSSRALERFGEALHSVRSELLMFVFLAMIMLYVSSVGIFIFEHEAQPEIFSSIPSSFWWAIASFTTVGYGDMIPITFGGRVFTTFILFVGLGVVAVPAAIVTTALIDTDSRIKHRKDSDETSQQKSTKGETPK
ncbi:MULTISPECIES: ion transporter [Halocynthiibacter]|uniref:Ion transporter n=1 Tax=Halocynthiibacter halioticoli TaxID=2986804 RepID=A0AAE3LQL7_9RHOB|nr:MULTISPECIES: ion transporter [Halocynthiibacter]MCV6823649.1 ion transporter [Halocynthiibacter halioticoli]MCW4056650.1 ion transporter [Halocynthiibacter sp. SDUM655004]MDE0590333.1 ion transporter [Halocynthiibacter sp. C4]